MAAVAAIIARKRVKEKDNHGYIISSPGPDGKGHLYLSELLRN